MTDLTPEQSAAMAMRDAIRRNDEATIDDIFGEGFDQNFKNPDGVNFLHHIATQTHAGANDILKTFLSKGVDVDARNDRGCTPLNLAIEGGKADMVHTMLDAGANVNAPGEADWSPLHFAIVSHNANAPQFIHDLVTRGASIRDFEKTENTDPLLLAIQTNNLTTTKALLDNGYEEALGLEAVKEGLRFSISNKNKSVTPFLQSWVNAREAQIAVEDVLAKSQASLNPIQTPTTATLKFQPPTPTTHLGPQEPLPKNPAV
jgi:ankyrin repeat protein